MQHLISFANEMAKIEKISEDKHDGDALSVACYDNRIFSGGADGKIKVSFLFFIAKNAINCPLHSSLTLLYHN